MGQIDSSFFSCQGLQDLFGPLSPDLVALQLSRGPLLGRLRSFHLGAIRFNLLETNQSLFLSRTRRPKPCTVAIPLPKSHGQEDITTSGLLYDTKAKPHFFKNNQGQWQWKEMQNDLNAGLNRLAKHSTDPAATIQVNAYGLNNTGSTSLNATYLDLFSNQSFDNSSGSWSYSHQTIHSLQDLNL